MQQNFELLFLSLLASLVHGNIFIINTRVKSLSWWLSWVELPAELWPLFLCLFLSSPLFFSQKSDMVLEQSLLLCKLWSHFIMAKGNQANQGYSSGNGNQKNCFQPTQIHNQNAAEQPAQTDIHSPFFLHSRDHPGLALVSHILTGPNYNTWSRAMKMGVECKEQARFSLRNLGKARKRWSSH